MTAVIIPAELHGRLRDEPPDGPAVYFLFRDGLIVYVGASEVPRGRVEHHRARRDRNFDMALYLPTPADELADAELKWIIRCCPMHNKVGNPSPCADATAWGADPKPGFSKIRLDIPNEYMGQLRVRAAESGLSMAEYCRRIVLEALNEKRILTPKPKK